MQEQIAALTLRLQLYDSHYNVRVTIKCRRSGPQIQEGE
jgi:hypothetical protein